jgi:hypothetical protein
MGIDYKLKELEHVSREIFNFVLATRSTEEKMHDFRHILTQIVTRLYLKNVTNLS